jgi:hypothetical protein
MKNFLILILAILFPTILYGQLPKYPEDVLCSPVLIKINGGQASGVFIGDSNYIFFVTARHVLFSFNTVKNKNKIDSVFYLSSDTCQLIYYPHNFIKDKPAVMRIDLSDAFIHKLVRYHHDQDIAIIAIGYIDSPNLIIGKTYSVNYYGWVQKNASTAIHSIRDNNRTYKDTEVGGEILLFGFPASIGLAQSPQFDYTRPLLRKGIIAGKFEDKKTIIIDCPSYYGNSGGPVWEIVPSKEMFLIGINTEFIPYIELWENISNGAINKQTMNSGYSVVTSIDFANDLIKGIYR